jgi:hypothetical protein
LVLLNRLLRIEERRGERRERERERGREREREREEDEWTTNIHSSQHKRCTRHAVRCGHTPAIVPHHDDALHNLICTKRLDVRKERAEPRRRVKEGQYDSDLVVVRIKKRPVAFKTVPVESKVGFDTEGECTRARDLVRGSLDAHGRCHIVVM